MSDNSPKPIEHDVVMDGHSNTPADGVVLGGLERIKHLLAHGRVEEKVDALLDAFEYGQAGLEIIINSLHDLSKEVREAAYFLLIESKELLATRVLQEYIPYEFFKCLYTWNEYTKESLCYSISSDWTTLVSVNNTECNFRNLKTGELIRTWAIYLPSSDELKDFPDRDVTIAFTPYMQTLVTGSEGVMTVWDIQTDELIRTLKGNYLRAFQPYFNERTAFNDGSYYDDHSDSEHPVKVWDLQTGQLVCTIYVHIGEESDIIINHLQQFLTIVDFKYNSRYGFHDIVIKVWDVQTGEKIDTFNMPFSKSEPSFAPTLSQDGQTIVSCSGDRSIKVWNLLSKKITHIFQGYPPIYLSHKANILVSRVSRRADDNINVWDLIRGEITHTLQGSTPVAFSTDTKVLVSGGVDNTIIVWNLQTGEKLCVLEGHSTQIVDIAISPDGRTIVSSSDNSDEYSNDGTIKVWGI